MPVLHFRERNGWMSSWALRWRPLTRICRDSASTPIQCEPWLHHHHQHLATRGCLPLGSGSWGGGEGRGLGEAGGGGCNRRAAASPQSCRICPRIRLRGRPWPPAIAGRSCEQVSAWESGSCLFISSSALREFLCEFCELQGVSCYNAFVPQL